MIHRQVSPWNLGVNLQCVLNLDSNPFSNLQLADGTTIQKLGYSWSTKKLAKQKDFNLLLDQR